jgi:hypothetical protein
MDGEIVEWLGWLWAIEPKTLAMIGVGVLLGAGRIGGWLQKRRRGQTLIQALGDSSRGQVVLHRGQRRRGLYLELQPAPEPFRQLGVRYQTTSVLDPSDWLGHLLGRTRSQMVVAGMLTGPAKSELVWVRGKAPDRAMGKGPDQAMWMHQRLDFVNAEYATRGPNFGAMRHVFSDLHGRFGPVIEQVRIQRGEFPEVEIVLCASGLNIEDVPALITTIRSAGRAALH